jgi:hypothetical protein
MTAPIVPVDSQRADWPRLVANAIRSAQNDIAQLNEQDGGISRAKLRFVGG